MIVFFPNGDDFLMKRLKYLWYRFRFNFPWLFKNPVHLHLELNNTCNSKCVYCYRQTPQWKKIPKKTFNNSSLRNILKLAYKKGIRAVKFNWRGEPFLSPIIGPACEIAAQLKFIDIMINTNGSIQIPDNVLNLATSISFSIDSSNPEIFEKNRKNLKINKVLKNLFYAINNAKGKIIVQRVIDKETVENHFAWQFNLCSSLKDIGSIDLTKVKFISKPLQERHADIYRFSENQANYFCSEPARSITIGVDGKVWACPFAYFEPESLSLGSVDLKNKQLWDKEKRNSLLKRLKSGDLKKLVDCRKCPGKC
jgi:MoaA/NifB/PqqE/SkfB family radical SAM enzyme